MAKEELGEIDGKKFSQWPKWEGKGLPLRGNCDLNNPRQKFLWMFTAPPGLKGAPLMMPVEYYEYVSWRLSILGADIVREPQLKYQPSSDVVNAWTSAGEWVSLDTPDREIPSLAKSIEALPAGDRAEIKAYVIDKMGLGDEEPEVPIGKYRMSDLSERIGVSIEQLIEIMRNFGMNLRADSLVGREVTDRILLHMGLDQ